MLRQELAVPCTKIRIEEYNLEITIVLKECPDHIRLIPCSSLHGPIFWILEWVIDVMYVYINPRLYLWQYIEDDVIHIGSDFRDMRGIDKEDIILIKRLE